MILADSDTLITDFGSSIHDVLGRVNPQWTPLSPLIPDIILATDPECHSPMFPLNSGITLLSKTEVSKYLCIDVLKGQEYACKPSINRTGLVDQPVLTYILQDRLQLDTNAIQQECKLWRDKFIASEKAPSSQNLGKPVRRSVYIRGAAPNMLIRTNPTGEVAVVSSRTFNSFYLRSMAHYAYWQKGDFLAHISGIHEDGDSYGQFEGLCNVTPESCVFDMHKDKRMQAYNLQRMRSGEDWDRTGWDTESTNWDTTHAV
eukprot:GHVO01011001.1.p1 GENE.GHVO01011001.1~~GHVO01011001.1.p1  ORF type:complete len:259 (+),score=31.51 GHVO01011001.1:712-1488(+)